MPESQAFAIATQQAYAAGKAPKSYGTREGRSEAKQKYDEPKSEYVQTANPKTKTSSLEVAFVMGFSDELQKISMAIRSSQFKGIADIKNAGLRKQTDRLTARAHPVSSPRESFSANPDPLNGNRTIQPPPNTAGGM